MNTNEEIKKLISEYYKKRREPISKEQLKYLKENKALLFEYYVQASNPQKDGNTLGNLEVWIYGNDRQDFTPHCHVMSHDKSVEVEISLIDLKIVNVKNCEFTSKMHKGFLKWLNSNSSKVKTNTNKYMLYVYWDVNNPNNTLTDFVLGHNVDIEDKDLQEYITNQL